MADERSDDGRTHRTVAGSSAGIQARFRAPRLSWEMRRASARNGAGSLPRSGAAGLRTPPPRGDEVRLLDDALIGVRIERPNRNDNVMDVCVPLSPHSESGSCSNFVHQTRESRGVSMSSLETQTLRGSACSRRSSSSCLRRGRAFAFRLLLRLAAPAPLGAFPDFRKTPHSKRCAITVSMIPYCFASSAVRK